MPSINVCFGIKPKLVLKDPGIIKDQIFWKKILEMNSEIMVWINQIYPELYLKHTNKVSYRKSLDKGLRASL